MFTQSINQLYCHIIKEYRCLKNVIHQLERTEWLLLSAFQQGLQQKLLFVFTQEKSFSYRFHFKVYRKSIGSFKIGIFKIALHLRDQHTFMGSNIDSTTFSYKTALSEANVKTNTMGSTKLVLCGSQRTEFCL